MPLSRHAWTASVVIVLGVGLASTWWVGRGEQAKQRTELITETRLMANAINVRRIRGLRGSEADINDPSYQRLKEQLTLVRSAKPAYRFLYLMGRRADGTVFFFVDSEPPDSKDYSPPGSSYREASSELQHLFEGGPSYVEGPFKDEWGTWVSGLTPIRDAASGKIIAVFGADLDASHWFIGVGMECIPPAAAALAVAALLTLLFTVQKLAYARRAQDALRLASTYNRSLIEASLDPLVTIGPDGKIMDANGATEAATGYPRAELIGQDFCGYFTEPGKALAGYQKVFQAGCVRDYPLELRHRDGHVTSVLYNASVYSDERGQVVGVFAAARDITERKHAEEVIAEANRGLERANSELKEMQSQVVQSEKLASIGQLAAGVAHEMNTPVGFVASNFQTLQKYMTKLLDLMHRYEALGEAVEDGERDRRLDILGQIKQARKDLKIDFLLQDIDTLFQESKEGLSRVTTIIKNLKDFSRIDQAQAFAEYDLNAGIDATLNVARNEIKYDADVKTELSPLPEVFCNSGQINQVLLNILLNAVQAIKSQKRTDRGTITVRTYATPDDVVCEISDDGPGIPQEIRHKIFDPFFTTKPVGQGTGLGLSVSYDIIVHKHHGQILVDSSVGHGTTFTVKLPLIACCSLAEQGGSTQDQGPAESSPAPG